MNFSKPRLSFAQIINMNVGFFGIQYSFGLQQSAVNPIYDMLGASPDEIPMLNLAGPVTGLLVQPIIGALSDRTWSPRFGRRKPYFFVGALICSLALFLFPFSSSLWMAAGLLWILDAGNNTAMEPYRAFVADKLDPNQQALGFQAQSFFTGFGQTLANVSLFIFPLFFVGYTGKLPTWVIASFLLGAVCSIGSIWWSMHTTPEIPPTEEELENLKSKPLGLLAPFVDIFSAIKNMPRVMWMLALVYLFQWYALFCYWQNSAKSVALNSYEWRLTTEKENTLWNKWDSLIKKEIKPAIGKKALDNLGYLPSKVLQASDPKYKSVWSPDEINSLDEIKKNKEKYEKAASWTGLVNGWYNIVTFLFAFLLVWFARRFSPKAVHFICLLLAAIGFLLFPIIENKYLLLPAITGFGIGWASMMGIPYLLVVNHIPKERYGVYMGIINMMIVIPMIIQNLSFGYILREFLHNDARGAIHFAGILLVAAAGCTLLINTKPKTA